MNENVFSLLVCGWGMLPLRQSRKKNERKTGRQKWHGQSAYPGQFLDLPMQSKVLLYICIYINSSLFFLKSRQYTNLFYFRLGMNLSKSSRWPESFHWNSLGLELGRRLGIGRQIVT